MFKLFFQNLILIAVYVATKPVLKDAEEEAIVQFAEGLLSDPIVVPVIENLQNEGLLDENGALTRYGLKIAQRIGTKPRSMRQINFEQLFKTSTPGYAMAALFTAETRLNELCEHGIMKQATPEVIDSMMDAGIRLQTWAEHFDKKNQEQPEEVAVPTADEGEE